MTSLSYRDFIFVLLFIPVAYEVVLSQNYPIINSVPKTEGLYRLIETKEHKLTHRLQLPLPLTSERANTIDSLQRSFNKTFDYRDVCFMVRFYTLNLFSLSVIT